MSTGIGDVFGEERAPGAWIGRSEDAGYAENLVDRLVGHCVAVRHEGRWLTARATNTPSVALICRGPAGNRACAL